MDGNSDEENAILLHQKVLCGAIHSTIKAYVVHKNSSFVNSICAWIKTEHPGIEYKFLHYQAATPQVEGSNVSSKKKIMDRYLFDYIEAKPAVLVWTLLYCLKSPVELEVCEEALYYIQILFTVGRLQIWDVDWGWIFQNAFAKLNQQHSLTKNSHAG